MDFTFTEDQQALRDSVSRFLMVEAVPEKLREIWQTGSGRSAELRAKLAAWRTQIGAAMPTMKPAAELAAAPASPSTGKQGKKKKNQN